MEGKVVDQKIESSIYDETLVILQSQRFSVLGSQYRPIPSHNFYIRHDGTTPNSRRTAELMTTFSSIGDSLYIWRWISTLNETPRAGRCDAI
jgi:hypothetical protein